ncbi:MAG: molecular chaperone TorD family protein [Coriobacteriaceae bacterium]|jgi:TorA maturation chaperone TorD|nr:molecular chaperone TorD family protein [Coriobacteriaceae bacterium]
MTEEGIPNTTDDEAKATETLVQDTGTAAATAAAQARGVDPDEAAAQARGVDLDEAAFFWQAKASAYELLAFSFRYPGNELVEALMSGEYAEAAEEIAEALGIEAPAGLAQALEGYAKADAEELFHTLRAEATRLFVGAPEPAVSPYEGVWRAIDEGVQPLLFVNPHSMAVERAMKAIGLGRPEGTNEPLDHVSAELEFLLYLSLLEAGTIEPQEHVEAPEAGWAASLEAFNTDHVLVWLPRFADAVIEKAREPFYREAAALLKAIITA